MCSFDCKPNFFELKSCRHDVSPPSVHLHFSSKSLGKIVRAVKKALVFVPDYCGCLSFFVWGVFFACFFFFLKSVLGLDSEVLDFQSMSA